MTSPVSKPAELDAAVLDAIRDRWSGWSFSDEPVPATLLRSVFEAARWAPSSWNDQPWRFLVGDRSRSPEIHALLAESLVPGNRAWASGAPVLIACWAVGRFTHDGSPNRFALHDLGQATALLQIQATVLGLRIHAMGGWDPQVVRDRADIPEDFQPGSILALGFPGAPSELTDPALRAKEEQPRRQRRPVRDLLGWADGICPDWARVQRPE
jgi:nitroreductase